MVTERLAALRALMQARSLDAYYIATADEHLNEYPLPNRLRRQWIGGFTGSAGDVLVGLDRAWLFVDSRYYEQAEQQIDPQEITISKLGLADAPSPEQIVAQSQWRRLGLDPWTTPMEQACSWQEYCALYGTELVPVTPNLIDALRLPAECSPPKAPLMVLPESLTGAAIADKVTAVRHRLAEQNATILPVTKLDQIAWLLNLRGQDVPHNPVFLAYAILTQDAVFLFRDAVDGAIAAQLPGVTVLPYDEYPKVLTSLATKGDRLLLAPKQTTWGTQLLLKDVGAHWQESEHPIELLKARKNAVELEAMRAANLKASCAKTLTLAWIETEMQEGKQLSEWDVANYIETLYAQSSGYIELSFPTIAGVGVHSSIVHYSNPSPTAILTPGSLLLLDSGCQFWGGTTDDTRTTVLGTATAEQKQRYTAVLQAHINCARQIFPRGATGSQLDGIARSSLWQSQQDFGHGTGHGVGVFLNVHEGPNGISRRVQTGFEAGMITSIEPGYYQPGWGGIRIENLYAVVPHGDADSGWLCFEPLTYIPFEPRLIAWELLEPAQIRWLEAYYAQVQQRLSPLLSPASQAWLAEVCAIPQIAAPQNSGAPQTCQQVSTLP